MSVGREALISMSFYSIIESSGILLNQDLMSWGSGVGGEGGQKVPISSYIMNKFWVVTHSMVTVVSITVLYT